MKEFKCFGIDYKEAMEIAQELGIDIEVDRGTMLLDDIAGEEREYEEMEEALLAYLEKKYGVKLPRPNENRTNMKIFGSDGEQYFEDIGFHLGIIFTATPIAPAN